MKRLAYGIVLTFLLVASMFVYGARVMGTQEYAVGASTWNAVINGDFETGDFTGWTVNGACIISNTTVHNGSYAAYISSYGDDNWITQTFSPMELVVDNGLTLDAWICPINVGGLDDLYPYSAVYLNFCDNTTGQLAFSVWYSWCASTSEYVANQTSEMFFTLSGWSTGQWNELQRNVTADIYSYYNQTSFTGVYLDAITFLYHYSNGSPGAFWVDDVSIPTAMTNMTQPAILSVSRTPYTPNDNQTVAVTANVVGADQSILSYTTDNVNWNNVSMSESSDIFNATIPAQLYNTTVQYEVFAYNSTIERWAHSDTYSYTISIVASPPFLFVWVTPSYVIVSGGQSQLFNANIFGNSPPYTYQWYVNGALVSRGTSPTLNFTAPPYYPSPTFSDDYSVSVAVTDSAGTHASGWGSALVPQTYEEVYYSVEFSPSAPLTNLNASINGLETPPIPSPVGENFTVEIHLRNATAANVPAGVAGVEVHFYFGNILNYCRPIGFVDELGQPGGALIGPLLYIFDGFYDDNFNPITNPPYTNATQYMVAAASETGPWNGNDGLVAKITFQITGQPSQNMSQQDFYAPLQIVFGEITDLNFNDVPFYIIQGTLRIDKATLIGDLNGDGKVGLDDLVLLANAYGSKPGDANWNPLADIAPPYGIISLTDLVTLATHYGEHYP